MSGGEITEEVVLDADGAPVFRAFDEIARRIKEIQGSVDGIQMKARSAADSFNANLAKSLNDLNKTVATLERLQKTVEKYDPQAIKGRETDVAYQQAGKVQRDEAKKSADYDKALAQVSLNNEKELARQSTVLWTESDKQRRRQDVERSRAQRLADQELTKNYLADQRAADAQRLKDQKTFEQNRVKQARDVAQQSVSSADPRDLNRLRDTSAMSLTALRAQRGYGSADDQRTLEQNIALEKEYLRLVDQRIAKQEVAAKADDRIRAGMDVRSGRLDEADLGKQLDLNAAKTRQADIQAAINAQIERSYKLSGDDLVAAERNLKVDEARLVVARQRVRELEQEAAAQARANRPASTGTGMFGNSGLLGVVGRTAAYGLAAGAIFSTLNTIKTGITEAIQYEDTLQKIGAVAGLTNGQMVDLDHTIQDVAENSRFARQEIAEASTTLAQAGFSATDIAQSLGAIAQLAAASGSSFAEATDVVTSAIGAFNLNANDAEHVANTLTSALNMTKLNIQQVALGIQYAGATAYENNLTFEDLTATMAALAQAGIKSGSTMGTGVRQLLALLISPTKKFNDELKSLGVTMQDIDVKTNGLTGVIDNLSKAGFTAADAYKAMGTRGAAIYLALRNQQDVALKVAQAQAQGTAAAVANDKAMNSLAAQWQRFKNEVNDATTNGLKPAGEVMTYFVKRINDEIAAERERSKYSEELIRQYGNQKDGLTKITESMKDYQQTADETAKLEEKHAAASEEVETALNKAAERADHEKQVLGSLDDAIMRVSVRKKTLTEDSAALAAETLNLEARFQGLAAELQGLALTYDNVTKALLRLRMAQLQQTGLQASQQALQAQNAVQNFATEGRDNLHALHQMSGFNNLPASIKKAIEIARSSTDMTARTGAVIQLQQFSQDPNNHLNPAASRLLGDYAGSVANLGLSMGQRTSASLNAATAQRLMQSDYQGIYSRILSSNSPTELQGIVKTLSGRLKGAKGADQQAIMSLLQQAASKESLVQPPQPQMGAGRKPRVNHLPERQDRAVDAEAIKADQAELAQALKGIGDSGGSVGGDASHIVVSGSRGLTLDRLKQNLERISNEKGTGALDQWITDRTQQVQDQLKTLKLSKDSGKGKQIWDDLQREIDAKREETQRAVGEAMAKVLQKMVDAAEKVAKVASDAADHAMNMVNARVSALGRASLAGKVPDYVQQTVERQAAYAKDDRDRAQIGINQNLLTGLTKARDFVGKGMDIAGALKLNGVDDPAIKSLTELNLQITELQNGTDELKASFGGEGLLPKGFNAQLQMAIANYKEVNHLTASWSDMISMNLTGALDAANQALTGFFSDILSGNASITQSFGKMVKAIIGYLSQLIAKMIATKLLEAALNIFGGSAPNPAAGNAQVQAAFDAVQPHIYGGLQLPALTGRYITDGVPNRDSVNAKIAKGEFVQRKWAVDNVGVDFMKDLNNRGAAALRDFGPKVMLPPPAHQKMSVYVVSPDQQPQMGPNDVLVTIANDIYRGGPTKQLIKEVAQGG